MSGDPSPEVSSSELQPTLEACPPPGSLGETRDAASVPRDASTGVAPSFRSPDRPPGSRALPVFLKPGQRIDDFELLRLLGEGSFGQVFLARHASLDRQVPLKVTANQGSRTRT